MVASTAGQVGAPGTSSYCASKHGVLGLMRAIAQDVAPFGVTCNAVLPGWVMTPAADNAAKREAEARGLTSDEIWSEDPRLVRRRAGAVARRDRPARSSFWRATGPAGSTSAGDDDRARRNLVSYERRGEARIVATVIVQSAAVHARIPQLLTVVGSPLASARSHASATRSVASASAGVHATRLRSPSRAACRNRAAEAANGVGCRDPDRLARGRTVQRECVWP